MGRGDFNLPKFQFRKRSERIDWRRIASLDVDRINKDIDIHALQDNIKNVTFCDIDTEIDTRNTDPNYVKLFKLAQLIIEYLLVCQDHLVEKLADMREKLQQSEERERTAKESQEKQQKELEEAKKECRRRKKELESQQQYYSKEMNSNPYLQCPYCVKAFVNDTYLNAHIRRRHPEMPPWVGSVGPVFVQDTDPKRIRELEEQLKAMRKQLEEKDRLLSSLSVKKDGDQLGSPNTEEMKEIYEKQLKILKDEMESLRGAFLKELHETNEKYLASEQSVREMQQRLGYRSHVGPLEDDDDKTAASRVAEMTRLQEEMMLKARALVARTVCLT